MITKLTLKNFKRFKEKTFAFKPQGITLLAGGNNSGKSSILQAMSVWEFCRGIIERKRGRKALEAGSPPKSGVGLNADEFSPVALPDLKYLWTNLAASSGTGEGSSLRVGLTWQNSADATPELEFGLALSNDRIFVKTTKSTVAGGMTIPQLAYLPSFAGIQPREERLSRAMQRRLIGRGMAGAALRNILYDLFEEHRKKKESLRAQYGRLNRAEWSKTLVTDPWWHLLDTLQQCFESSLKVKPFDEFHQTLLEVFFFKGKLVKTNFKKHSGYNERDIMTEGSGFLQWLSVYALAVNPLVNVLLLDEPDAHLHPTWQAELFFRLQQRVVQGRKQVLMATHSTELLRTVEPGQIFELSTKRSGYLSSNDQRVGLFAGIGSEYAPKLDMLKRKKRVVFVEGDFEECILPTLMGKTSTPWNTNWVFWKTTLEHADRFRLFKQLEAEIPGLKGVSVRDRDDKIGIGEVGVDCIENNYRGHKANGLLCITWRRRELENYLLVPRAIAEAVDKTEEEVRAFLCDRTGLAHTEDATKSACTPGLHNAYAKEALYEGMAGKKSLEHDYGCTRYDIAGKLVEEEVAEDLKTVFSAIHTFFAS